MIMEQLGRRQEQDHSLITKFASAQVKYYGSIFGVYFKSHAIPINTITIDEDKTVHGYMVSNTNAGQSTTLQNFANKMKGIMSVHLVHVKTMKSPIIINLN